MYISFDDACGVIIFFRILAFVSSCCAIAFYYLVEILIDRVAILIN